MLCNVLFTILPVMAQAAYLDPSLLQQKPLLDSKPASGRVTPLAVGSNLLCVVPTFDLTAQQPDQNLDYTYTISSNDFSTTLLEHLQNSMATYSTGGPIQQTITNIPLNTSLPGTTTFYTISELESWSQAANHFTWTHQQRLHLQPTLGANLPLLGVGIRKSSMISMPAESATLDFTTPYIHVPKGIWDVLLLATHTEQQARDGQEALYVDCGASSIFPDLVFGVEQEGCEGAEEVDGEDEQDDDDDADELIITPEQYILQTTDGKCMLLVKNADSRHDDRGVIKLGWAVVRGRDVVLDWRGTRVGFEK